MLGLRLATILCPPSIRPYTPALLCRLYSIGPLPLIIWPYLATLGRYFVMDLFQYLHTSLRQARGSITYLGMLY